MVRRTLVTACAVVTFAMFGPAVRAYAADATLYEVTENMKLKTLIKARQQQSSTHRQASSALSGVAAPGTVLCPLPVACVINATGSDDIDILTGLGTFKGKWSVVVPGDNPVDAPEFELIKGNFDGVMDFSPALVYGLPYGTVKGTLKNGKDRYPFTGVFYLPFTWPGDESYTPLYLGAAGPVPVGPKEYSLGYPTVKFEITLGAQ